MSKIEYMRDAEAAIAKARKDAMQYPGYMSAFMVGCLTADIEALARRAELDSQLPQIRERIANSMTFDLREASELIDSIIEGVKRQHGEIEDAFVSLGDAAQALHEAYEIQQEPADLFESMGMDKPQFPTLRAA